MDQSYQAEYRASLNSVQRWVEEREYKGYDPGDGLTSWFRPLTFGNQFAERVLQQLIWKSPINLRPIAGIKPMESTKGRGFMAWGYLLMFKATNDFECLDKAASCLKWLERNSVTKYPGKSWANHFDFTTRSGTMRAGEPTIVWTGLIGQAFLEAFEQTKDEHYLQIARLICDWILKVPRLETPGGTCLSYTAAGRSWIHNSNMLGAGMLARTWKHVSRQEYLDVAQGAMDYSCGHQLHDGAWYYGEEEKYHWIDNFHTAYNLDSLKRFIDSTGETRFARPLERGYVYFRETFFEKSGRPRYYHNKTMPVDIQCAAQAIDTLSFFTSADPDALPLAEKVARWTISNMQDPSGYFHYRHYPALRAKTPYFHWGQASMFKALAHLTAKVQARDSEGVATPGAIALNNLSISPASCPPV